MKKVKFNLEELKINSFVTSLRDAESDEIKGGTHVSCLQNCFTNEFRTCALTIHQECQTNTLNCGPFTENTNCMSLQSMCC